MMPILQAFAILVGIGVVSVGTFWAIAMYVFAYKANPKNPFKAMFGKDDN